MKKSNKKKQQLIRQGNDRKKQGAKKIQNKLQQNLG